MKTVTKSVLVDEVKALTLENLDLKISLLRKDIQLIEKLKTELYQFVATEREIEHAIKAEKGETYKEVIFVCMEEEPVEEKQEDATNKD